MRRTATHVLNSPNPIQLETRILANHGADRRFAFLRGRWKRSWLALKQEAKDEKERKQQEMTENKKSQTLSSLANLGDYGDSDDENDVAEVPAKSSDDKQLDSVAEDSAKMEARRARAREWSAKRKAEKEKE